MIILLYTRILVQRKYLIEILIYSSSTYYIINNEIHTYISGKPQRISSIQFFLIKYCRKLKSFTEDIPNTFFSLEIHKFVIILSDRIK